MEEKNNSPVTNPSFQGSGVFFLGGFVLLVLLLNSANAYYSFVRNNKRTTWPQSVFTADHSGTTDFLGSLDLSGLNVGSIPNNDTLGLIVVADAQVWPGGSSPLQENCDDGGPFGPPTINTFYEAIFLAMAEWDDIAQTTINLAFVCSPGDFTASSFDNFTDEATLEIFRNGQPVFNGINEIAFDDTTGADMVDALDLGIDPTVLLGLAFPYDTNGKLIIETDSNGILNEGFIILNVGSNAPANASNIQGVITHEFGHFLGLGHVPSTNIASGFGDDKVPTMYFALLDDPSKTKTLEFDDLAGITVSYPASGEPLGSYGSISGEVLFSSGGTLIGAGVFAVDPTTGDEISVIIGGNPDIGNTTYIIEGVPAGSYNVSLMALDGSAGVGGVNSASNGQIDSIFSTPAFSFPAIYFDEVSNEAEATPVTVATGADTPEINFGVADFLGGLFGQILTDPDNCQASPWAGTISLSSLLFLTSPFLTLFVLRRRHRKTISRSSARDKPLEFPFTSPKS